MKFVITTPFYPPQTGVLASYAAGIEGGLKRAGADVQVIVFESRLPPGARHIHLFINALRAFWKADAVLALDTWSVGMPTFLAAKIMRIPCAVRIGGDFLWETYVGRTGEDVRLSEFYTRTRSFSLKERLIHAGTRYMLKTARVVFTTQFQENIWKKAYAIPAEHIFRIENFVPAAHPQPEKGLVLVSAGRPTGLKNRDLLSRIVTNLKKKYPTLELDTRLLTREEHLRRIASAYAVIIPSLSEVCSNTAIDAVVTGKPFIMTEDTGTKERFGECGIFVDTRSESAMSHAIESLLEADTYARFCEKINSFTYTHSWDEIAREIMSAFK